MIRRVISLVTLSVSCYTITLAQESDLGNWLMYFGNKQINEKFDWHNEVQLRNYNALGDLEQLLIRTGIGYDFSEGNNNLLLGYGYILSENYINEDEKVSVQEHRIFQQFITSQRFDRFKFLHRYRFEERFIEDNFRFRFRYFLSVNVSLSKEAFADGTFYISAYNEIFLNGDESVFDRNRLYGGLGYRLSSALRFELAYMNQFLESGGRDQVNIATFFNF